MELFRDELGSYLDSHCDFESDLLRHIERQTNLKVPLPRMLSGHYQGRVLSMLSKLIRPHRILEIGTFTGYATLCLAEGLREDGLIHTIEINAELEDKVRNWFESSPYARQIVFHLGSASEIIPGISESFDLVFIDADKKNNELYYELMLERMGSGGVIIIDNVLWSGKVLDAKKDPQTELINKFNAKIASDSRVEKLILPVRDGLLVIRKK